MSCLPSAQMPSDRPVGGAAPTPGTVPEHRHDRRNTVGNHTAGTPQRSAPFAHALNVWLSRLLTLYGDRVLPLDVAVAQCRGRLSTSPGYDNVDLMIAATALVHELTVVTRKVRHFERTGVPVLNPLAPDGDV